MTVPITLSNLVNLQNETTAVTTINNNNAAVTSAFSNALDTGGDAMSGTLDMNSNRILNLPKAATADEPLRLQELSDFVGGGTVTNIPVGGNTGDILVKNSNTNYDVKWASDSTSVAGGTNITVTGTSPATVSTVNNPVFSTSVTTPSLINTGTLTLPTSTDTIVGRNTTDTLVNKTIDTASPNTVKIAGTSLTAVTGTGNVVLATSPILTTPTLGVATATTVNKVTITAPATAATLTIPNNVTMTGPASSGTVMTLGNTETVAGAKTFNSGNLILAGATSGTTTLNATATASGILTLPATTDTIVGRATTDTLTNKTFNSTGTGNTLQVSGVTVSAGQYPGEPSTGSATSGNVGEYIQSNIPSVSAVSLTSTTPANLTSITVPAGDWDLSLNAYANPAATTSMTALLASISTTSATRDTTTGGAASDNRFAANVPASPINILVGPLRVSNSTSTTYFAVVQANFTVSTCSAYGILRARRAR